MVYFSNGGFNWNDLYFMPIKFREFYWRELLKAKEEENEQIEASKSKSNNYNSLINNRIKKIYITNDSSSLDVFYESIIKL